MSVPQRSRARRLALGTTGFLAVWTAVLLCSNVFSDSVTMTTYYPAPSGIYTKMITTGATWLARDGGSVGIGTSANLPATARLAVMGGRVGVGIANPATALHVVGSLMLQDGTQGNGRVLTSDAAGQARWGAALSAGSFSTIMGARRHGGSAGAYVTVSCPAGDIMISGGCDAQDECSGSSPTNIYGGMPQANGWACPLWPCSVTTPYVRCYTP